LIHFTTMPKLEKLETEICFGLQKLDLTNCSTLASLKIVFPIKLDEIHLDSFDNVDFSLINGRLELIDKAGNRKLFKNTMVEKADSSKLLENKLIDETGIRDLNQLIEKVDNSKYLENKLIELWAENINDLFIDG
jgi:hypothetical protein